MKAQLEPFPGGSSVIWSGAYGLNFRVMFVQMDGETGIGMAAFALDFNNVDFSWTLERVNKFNLTAMGATLTLAEDGSVSMQMKIPVPWRRVDREIFMRFFAPWLGDLREFSRLSA